MSRRSRDLALVTKNSIAGRLVYGVALVSDADGNQDVATVAGVPNLRQQLTTHVTTRKGSNILYPRWAKVRWWEAVWRRMWRWPIESLTQQIAGTTSYVSATLLAVDGSKVQVQAGLSRNGQSRRAKDMLRAVAVHLDAAICQKGQAKRDCNSPEVACVVHDEIHDRVSCAPTGGRGSSDCYRCRCRNALG